MTAMSAVVLILVALPVQAQGRAPRPKPFEAVVEVEEDVYSYEPLGNGSGPLWCSGSTCLVRIGDALSASGVEKVADAKPLNNCRWTLFQRGSRGWEHKKKLTGREWDYDFRRLFFTWSDDVTKGEFHDWVEIASRDKTCGWISPGDLWVAPDGAVHLLWTERAIDTRLRREFFPDAKQAHALNCAVVRAGKVVSRRSLLASKVGESNEIPGRGRFQSTPEGRLFVFCYVSGSDAAGNGVSEDRVMELYHDGSVGPWVKVPMKHPMSDYFTATVRAGSPPSRFLELLGHRAGKPTTISYARVRLD